MRQRIESIGGRRFLMCLGCGAVTSVLVWHAKISDVVYRDIVIATVAAYIIGNTTQKVKATTKEEADA
jgi:hypothetical protein